MYITANHSDHMNITESRNHAVKLMTRRSGMEYFLNGEKVAKGRILTLIKKGIYDGYHFVVMLDMKRVELEYNPFAGNVLFPHKIGN